MNNNYLSTLLATDKYDRQNQIVLKDRVYRTFDALLQHTGRRALQPGQHLLDLGSADGSLVEVAANNGLIARGLDVTDNINFETDALPIESGTIDIVTAVSLVEHLHSPALMFSETLRVLKPGGAFILVTPNWRFSYREFFDDPTHVQPYTDRSIDFALNSAGFDHVLAVPWLVCKPSWMWTMPFAFQVARAIPFRWSPNTWVPRVLTGKSKTILAIGIKPSTQS
ncbi:MAG: class I SAM-dependent methyltransferase [Pseudomonadota bacterium]